MPRKNALITVAANDGILSFTVGEAGSFNLNPTELSDEVRARAEVHGYVQKISDAAAMPKSEFKGKSAAEIATMKLNAMTAVRDRLVAGDWSKRSGEGSGAVAGIIYRAFEEYVLDVAKAKKVKTPPTPEAIRARYDAMSRGEQLALRSVPEISAIMDRIRADRGAKVEVDTSTLLGELGL